MGITKLITTKNDSINYDVTLQEVLDKMVKNKIKHLVLLKDKKALAILTERDILSLYTKHTNLDLKAIDFAKKELIKSKDNRRTDYILGLMVNYTIRRVIITGINDEYIGTLLQEDIIYQFEQDIYKSHKKIHEIIKSSNQALHVSKNASIQESIELMTDNNIGSILVYDNNTPIGILTESDIISLAKNNINTDTNIQKYMHSPIISFSKNELFFVVVNKMKENNIRRAVIFDEEKDEYFVITSKDILNNIKGNYVLYLESKLADSKVTFNNLEEAVIELFDNDEEQIIHWFNKKAYDLFKLKIDNNITSIIPNENWNDIYKKLLNNANEQIILKIEKKVFKLSVSKTSILDNLIIKLLFTDITELMQAKENMQLKFNETFEQESIGIINIDFDYKIIDLNSKVSSLFGYSKEELLGKNILDLTYEKDQQRTIKKVTHLLENQEERYFSFEKRCVKKDGSIIWLNVTNSISFDENNKAQYFICFIMDISKQIDFKNELINNEEKFKTLYEEVPYPYQSLDENGLIKDVNKTWLELTGYKKSEIINSEFSSLIEDTQNNFKNNFTKLLENKFIHDTKHTLITKDNKKILIRIDGKVSNTNGEIRTHCIIKDITKKEKIDRKLQLSDIVFENTTEGIIITNKDNKIVSINKAFTKITQYEEDDVLGKTPSMLQSGEHNKKFYKNIWSSLKLNGFWKGEIWNRRKNGEVYPEWLNISTVKNDENKITNYVALFSDISKVKNTAAKIEYLAHHDPLTDLPNRLLLHARLDKSIERCTQEQKRLALLFIDIDNFKLINDTYGHSIGDKIINLVAKRLKRNIRKNDTIARIGGDEFIIVIEDILQQNDIQKIASKILSDFKDPLKLEDYLFETTISMGVSLFPNNGITGEDLIKHADTAMYHAKNSGRNQFKFYKNEMTSEIFEKIIMKQEIKDALENKEFEVYYQAQVDIKTNKIVGAEALVRWNHKSLGLIPPDSFIPHAEETKLIIPLGEFVLNTACTFMKKLHDQKILKEGKIAVNISGDQIKHSDIIKTVINGLKYSQLDSQYLEVEVTETFIMEDIEKSISILQQLKNLGVYLSIDDFGTGYSSLSYLKQFPINKLKIDKSFIDELPYNHKDIAIAKAVIALAKGLRIKTIAEGVEKIEQKEFLEKEECDEIQGWYYAKALKEEDFIDLVKKYNGK